MNCSAINACGRSSFGILLSNCTADFNADNFVDFFDYALFVDLFEHGCAL